MLYRFPAPVALMAAAIALGGCASDSLLNSNGVTTSALTPPAANPACVSLASQIDALRQDGVAEKIEKAAAKKYKMTPADLTKADQLTKANADFQAKCSTLPPKASAAQVSSTSAPGAAPASVSASATPAPKAAPLAATPMTK